MNDHNEFREKQEFPITVVKFGLNYERRLGKNTALTTGIGYGRFGVNYRPDVYDSYFHTTAQFLKIPIMLQAEVYRNNKITAGVALGFLNNFLFRVRQKSYNGRVVTRPGGTNGSTIWDPKNAEYKYTGFTTLKIADSKSTSSQQLRIFL